MNADLEKICQDWRDIGVDEDSIRRRAEMLMQSMAFNPGWMLKERIEKIIDAGTRGLRYTKIPNT